MYKSTSLVRKLPKVGGLTFTGLFRNATFEFLAELTDNVCTTDVILLSNMRTKLILRQHPISEGLTTHYSIDWREES